MKKDKDWLSEQVGELNSTDAVFNESGVSYIDTAVSMERVYDLIYQLDEPEVPVVPEDVYEHIKMNKVGGVPLDIALDGAIGKLEILWGDGIQFHEFRNNQDNYAKAWLAYPNIEVEKEPLYIVKLPMPNTDSGYAMLSHTGYIWIDGFPSKYKLTEKEINDIDKRYWSFAAPVEEVEE